MVHPGIPAKRLGPCFQAACLKSESGCAPEHGITPHQVPPCQVGGDQLSILDLEDRGTALRFGRSALDADNASLDAVIRLLPGFTPSRSASCDLRTKRKRSSQCDGILCSRSMPPATWPHLRRRVGDRSPRLAAMKFASEKLSVRAKTTKLPPGCALHSRNPRFPALSFLCKAPRAIARYLPPSERPASRG